MSDVQSVAVLIASLGRPENVRSLLERLGRQTLMPNQVVLSMESESDCPDLGGLPFDVETVFGPRGMTVQRNRALDLVHGSDAFVFFDDDYVPSNYALEGIVRGFNAFPEAGGLNGRLIADGARTSGISPPDAVQMVEKEDSAFAISSPTIIREVSGLYGCNMAYRSKSAAGQRFDEDLPLYGWQEDIDFSMRVQGRMLVTDSFYGVHCGEKRGRERSGVRLGYSQIANPVHLLRKGTMPQALARRLMFRTFLANHLRMVKPEPWLDRRGRAAGNWRAIWDMLTGKMHPRRILEIGG